MSESLFTHMYPKNMLKFKGVTDENERLRQYIQQMEESK